MRLLADSVTGLTSLKDYGLLGVVMLIFFSFAGVVIRTLWKMLVEVQRKYDALQELFRTDYVDTLRAARESMEKVLPIVLIYQERERDRERGRDGR